MLRAHTLLPDPSYAEILPSLVLTAAHAAAIPSNCPNVWDDSVNCPAARFSRRWATDDVPGISAWCSLNFTKLAQVEVVVLKLMLTGHID